jgi:hypothetical protein
MLAIGRVGQSTRLQGVEADSPDRQNSATMARAPTSPTSLELPHSLETFCVAL